MQIARNFRSEGGLHASKRRRRLSASLSLADVGILIMLCKDVPFGTEASALGCWVPHHFGSDRTQLTVHRSERLKSSGKACILKASFYLQLHHLIGCGQFIKRRFIECCLVDGSFIEGISSN